MHAARSAGLEPGHHRCCHCAGTDHPCCRNAHVGTGCHRTVHAEPRCGLPCLCLGDHQVHPASGRTVHAAVRCSGDSTGKSIGAPGIVSRQTHHPAAARIAAGAARAGGRARYHRGVGTAGLGKHPHAGDGTWRAFEHLWPYRHSDCPCVFQHGTVSAPDDRVTGADSAGKLASCRAIEFSPPVMCSVISNGR